MRTPTVLLVILLLAAIHAHARSTPLPAEKSAWEPKVFLEPGSNVSEADAATLAIVNADDRGASLSIGPWRHGRWGARMQYARKLPFTAGTLRGVYRTENLPAQTVELSIYFFRGKDRLTRRTLRLAPSSTWKPFHFVVWSAPSGADGLAPALGLAVKTEGRVLFSDLSFSPDLPKFDGALPPLTRPAPPPAHPPTPFFRLHQHNGAWWLMSPSGRPFYSLGVDGPPLPADDPQFQKGLASSRWLVDHGFNSLAGWTNTSRWAKVNDELAAGKREPFALFPSLQSATLKDPYDRLADARGEMLTGDHAFPDPFDPRFEAAYRAKVKSLASTARGKPWLAAYFADNELSHQDLHRHLWSRHCSAAFVAFLRERHGSIEALNAAWRAQFSSFEDMLSRRPHPTLRQGKQYDDFRQFARRLVQRYIEITLRCLREHDPDHLIFSNRFMIHDLLAAEEYLDLYKAYDALAVNLYPGNQSPGLSDAETAALRRAHEITGKPILIGEWSVPAIDSGLYSNAAKLDWSWNESLLTQSDRARQAAHVTVDFYNLPFVIGAHWFTWRDFDNEKRQANRGLMQANGEPWKELVRAAGEANGRVMDSTRR